MDSKQLADTTLTASTAEVKGEGLSGTSNRAGPTWPRGGSVCSASWKIAGGDRSLRGETKH
jgi:hypothetical protein